MRIAIVGNRHDWPAEWISAPNVHFFTSMPVGPAGVYEIIYADEKLVTAQELDVLRTRLRNPDHRRLIVYNESTIAR